MDLELKGKTAIITGGSRGIGKAVGREFGLEGMKVALVARGQEALEETAIELSNETGGEFITIVADTGDFEQISLFRPQDATTNPTLILKAVKEECYSEVVDKVVFDILKKPLSRNKAVDLVVKGIQVALGSQILKIIPGRVSSEIDPRLSFDAAESVVEARKIIALYEDAAVDRSRVLIKLASTWEGIEAAKILQAESINCNMTLNT